MQGSLKRVVADRTFRRPSSPENGCTRELILECGHNVFRKASRPVPKRAHCPDCENAELSK